MAKTSTQQFNAYNDNRQDVIQLLQECHDECRHMFMECAPKESGQNLSFLHLKRLQACIEICGATANYLLKDGIKTDRLCGIAATICEQCAASCEKLENEHFQHCAGLCREAAEACLEESQRLRKRAA
jgi:hypothetical protein